MCCQDLKISNKYRVFATNLQVRVLQLLDDRLRALCLIGSVHHKGYPLMLENSSSGTIITILPPGPGGFDGGEKILCLF